MLPVQADLSLIFFLKNNTKMLDKYTKGDFHLKNIWKLHIFSILFCKYVLCHQFFFFLHYWQPDNF